MRNIANIDVIAAVVCGVAGVGAIDAATSAIRCVVYVDGESMRSSHPVCGDVSIPVVNRVAYTTFAADGCVVFPLDVAPWRGHFPAPRWAAVQVKERSPTGCAGNPDERVIDQRQIQADAPAG